MATDPRPHIERRSEAIGRLRTISATAAVAGLAGTAGLGAVAALSWSGDPAATPLPVTTSQNRTTDQSGTTTRPKTNQVQPVDPNGGFAQPPTVTATPRTGRNHAASGGSH